MQNTMNKNTTNNFMIANCLHSTIITFFFNVPARANRFYSTSHDKLFINSTPDNIVFIKYNDNTERSALRLSYLKPFVDLSEFSKFLSKEKSPLKRLELFNKLQLDMNDLQLALSKIMPNLNFGTYKFEIYLYYEDIFVNYPNKETYTEDFFNKNELNKLWSSYGYIQLCHLIGFLGSYPPLRIHYFMEVCDTLTQLFNRRLADEKIQSNIKLNKGTLLVISKLGEDDNVYKYSNSNTLGGFKLGVNKRFYSTSHPYAPPFSPDKLYINSTPDNIVFNNYTDNTQKSVLILPSLNPFLYFA
jgi:hypothetical protein